MGDAIFETMTTDCDLEGERPSSECDDPSAGLRPWVDTLRVHALRVRRPTVDRRIYYGMTLPRLCDATALSTDLSRLS